MKSTHFKKMKYYKPSLTKITPVPKKGKMNAKNDYQTLSDKQEKKSKV